MDPFTSSEMDFNNNCPCSTGGVGTMYNEETYARHFPSSDSVLNPSMYLENLANSSQQQSQPAPAQSSQNQNDINDNTAYKERARAFQETRKLQYISPTDNIKQLIQQWTQWSNNNQKSQNNGMAGDFNGGFAVDPPQQQENANSHTNYAFGQHESPSTTGSNPLESPSFSKLICECIGNVCAGSNTSLDISIEDMK